MVDRPAARRFAGVARATIPIALLFLVGACGKSADDAPLDLDDAAGRWHPLATEEAESELSAEQLEEIARLEAIGYLAGSMAAPTQSGVTIHDPERAFPGLNLYTSGHGAEAVLMDMDGRELHRWSRGFDEIWPEYPVERTGENAAFWLRNNQSTAYWRRAHVLPNGDILVIFEGLGIARLDRDSNVLWANPCRAHHDLEVMPDGDIYVLTRRARMIPRIDREHPILEDFVSVLDADGREKRRVSLLECMVRSTEYAALWTNRVNAHGDVLHTNSVRVLDGRFADRMPELSAGRVLVSMLYLHAVAVVDLDEGAVVWARRGPWRYQHDPRMLDNGHLLVFDNRGRRMRSAVYELEPRTMTEVWSYSGTEEQPFYTATCGVATRLANGNTLITESDTGRAFEVTPEREVVWEFWNPHRAGPGGELIATLFEVTRLPEEFAAEWAQTRP